MQTNAISAHKKSAVVAVGGYGIIDGFAAPV
jgi:hypothetical protein